MMRYVGRCLASVALVMGLGGADWRHFRGPKGSWVGEAEVLATGGAAQETAWRTPLPGRGLSGPIVVGERVIVTCSSGVEQDRLHVICFDSRTGRERWHRQFRATGRTMSHTKCPIAAPTPASDGERVVALFSTNDLVCLDLEGNLLWLRGLTHDYQNVSNSLGMASSPIVTGGIVVSQLETDSESCALGIDLATGQNRWKIERPRAVNWTSPLIIEDEVGRSLALLQGSQGLVAVEPATGREVWRYAEGCSTIPSSVAGNGLVFVPAEGLTALEPPASGSMPRVVWKESRLGPRTASPIVYEGRLYTLNGAGVLHCAEGKSGAVLWQLRLKGPFTSTPVAAAGHLYVFSEEGLAQIVALGDQGRLVATRDLGDTILCTPAIGHDGLFVRSDRYLWKLAGSTSGP